MLELLRDENFLRCNDNAKTSLKTLVWVRRHAQKQTESSYDVPNSFYLQKREQTLILWISYSFLLIFRSFASNLPQNEPFSEWLLDLRGVEKIF